MKVDHPVKRDLFKMRQQRMIDNASHPTHKIMLEIPVILCSECKLILNAYYGNTRRMLWAIAREEFYLWRRSKYHRLLLWICDTVGWTKLVYQPETETCYGHHHRHGRHCSGGPNCSQNCIDPAIPKWFKRISRWDKLYQ